MKGAWSAPEWGAAWVGLFLTLGVIAASGCASGTQEVPPRYPGELRKPAELGPDFMARQQVTARWDGRRVRFEAVLQKRGSRLRLLVLGPQGTRAFLVEQCGPRVRLVSYVDRELPFPARYVLLDIHRAFAWWTRDPPEPELEGRRAFVRGAERVTERWSGGALRRRRFTRVDEKLEGAVDVRYEQGMEPEKPLPETVRLHNEWLGYHLRIRTLRYTRL